MLTKRRYALTLPAGERLNPSFGSLFHGALMELLPEEYAAELHRETLRPFSQAAYYDREQGAIWELATLDERVAAAIDTALAGADTIYLKQKGYPVGLSLIERSEASYESLADSVFLAPAAPSGVTLDFLTATSFKQNNSYVLLPDAALILGSLLSRWNAFTTGQTLVEEGLREKLAALTSIHSYSLRTQLFSLERVTLKGFVGRLELRLHGSDMQRRLLGLIMSYAPYAGVGIKTAVGMGRAAATLNYRGNER